MSLLSDTAVELRIGHSVELVRRFLEAALEGTDEYEELREAGRALKRAQKDHESMLDVVAALYQPRLLD